MRSNEKGNNIKAATGELLNRPFNIVHSVATQNIEHNAHDQIAGSSQSWQILPQQQLLGNNLVRNEIENNIETRRFVQLNRAKTTNDCNSRIGEVVAMSTNFIQKVQSWSITIETQTACNNTL